MVEKSRACSVVQSVGAHCSSRFRLAWAISRAPLGASDRRGRRRIEAHHLVRPPPL